MLRIEQAKMTRTTKPLLIELDDAKFVRAVGANGSHARRRAKREPRNDAVETVRFRKARPERYGSPRLGNCIERDLNGRLQRYKGGIALR